MGKFVNPFTDIGFKIIFGQPASKPFLITLLNELLANEHQIEDLVFLDKEDHADNVRDKGIIYDLYCRTSTGEYIIVEMQNRRHPNFVDRTFYYMCRAVSRQVESPLAIKIPVEEEDCDDNRVCEPAIPYGSDYKLHTVYGIFFMDFKEPCLPNRFRVDGGILDLESHEMLYPHFRPIYLQFPYFAKELDACKELLDRLFYALMNMKYWDRMPQALQEQVFAHLDKLAAVANLSLENRIAYDRAVDKYNVERLVEEDIRQQATTEGIAEGMAKGMAKGMKQGLEQGLEQGKKEGRMEMARNLKLHGVSPEVIALSSGLSLDEIEKL